jgi:hypothetical protein
MAGPRRKFRASFPSRPREEPRRTVAATVSKVENRLAKPLGRGSVENKFDPISDGVVAGLACAPAEMRIKLARVSVSPLAL